MQKSEENTKTLTKNKKSMKNKFFSLKGLLVVAAGAFMLGTTGCKPNETPTLPMLTITYNGTEISGDVTPPDVAIDGAIIPVTIKSSRNWTVLPLSAENAAWITVSPSSGGSGTKSVEIEVKQNEGLKRGPVSVAFRTADGAITRNVIITQTGNGDVTEIYRETVGTASVASPYPLVATYTDWAKTGSGASDVTYSAASGNVSVRSSGQASAGYDGASGGNNVFFGTNSPAFVINNITLPEGETNFNLSFGGQRSLRNADGTYDNVFSIEKFTVSLSKNGTDWSTPITYTTTGGTEMPNWVLASADFTLSEAVSKLYIKFAASEFSVYRLDDIVLTTGNGGQIVNLEGSGPPPDFDGTFVTVKQLRDMYTGTNVTISENIAVKGSVVVDIAANNVASRKNLMIQDETGGIAVRLVGDAVPGEPSELPKDKEVQVVLQGLTLQAYEGLVQVNNCPNANVTLTGQTKPITPVEITADQFASGDYQSMLVKIKDVQFISTALGKTLDDVSFKLGTSAHSGIMLENAGGTQVLTFISSYATFKTGNVPGGSGSAVGVGSIAGNPTVKQLMPRDMNDLAAMTGARFTESSFLSVSPEAVSVPATGGSVSFSVSANVEWAAAVQSGGTVTPTITSGATGSNSGTVTLNFPANTDTENTKTATVRVSTTASGVQPKDVVFTQAKATPPGGGTATFDFAVIGAWTTNTPLTGDAATFNVDGITATFARGTHTSNDPAGNQANGGEVRMYALGSNGGGNELTITAPSGKNISKVEFTYSQTGPDVVITVGSFPAPYSTWTGNDNSINFRVKPTGTSSQQLRITKFVVTYN